MARVFVLPVLVAIALPLAACMGAPPAKPQPTLDARFAAGRRTERLAALAAQMQVPEGENIRVVEVARDADTSHHLVGVRDREPYHRHDKSALLAVVLSGRGRMRIDGVEQPVDAGSVLYVPRGTPHAFINGDTENPAVAYVVFSPPFDGADRVPVEE